MRKDRPLRVERVPDVDDQPIIGPQLGSDHHDHLPRLARRTITLTNGHEVGLAVCGRGVPLVLVHGFTAEGILYAQSLSRLVSMGFKVIAIDTAGHGGTLGLPTSGSTMEAYTRLLGGALDELGIRRAVLAGHSMGGRLVTELAASEPDRAMGVVLIDAIVGDTWDQMVNLFRLWPPLLAGVGAALAVDTLTTVPLFQDPGQARKLGRLVLPTVAGHVRKPWRMAGPAISIMRSRGSGWMLDRVAELRLPLFVIHGDRDLAVPMATARASAKRGHGELVIVHKAGHSWVLKDPQTLPAIMARLLNGRLGQVAFRQAFDAAGLDRETATIDEIEEAFYEPDARVVALTPPQRDGDTDPLPSRGRYQFTIDDRWVEDARSLPSHRGLVAQ